MKSAPKNLDSHKEADKPSYQTAKITVSVTLGVFKKFILRVGLICLCRARVDKLTSEADKPFEGINKAVSERRSHSRPANVNGYRTDEEFL